MDQVERLRATTQQIIKKPELENKAPSKSHRNGTNGATAAQGQTSKPRRWLALYDEHWVAIGTLTILLGAVGAIIILWAVPAKLAAIATGALCLLVFTALGLNMLSDDEDLSSGEVQKAITFAVLFAYFGLLAFPQQIANQTNGISGPAAQILQEALQHFWIIVLSVVGFYFGGRIIDQVREVPAGPAQALVQDTLWEIRKQVRQGTATIETVAPKLEQLDAKFPEAGLLKRGKKKKS